MSLVKSTTIVSALFLSAVTLSFANVQHMDKTDNADSSAYHGMWTCKTNASSATSSSTEEHADNNMEKHGKNAKQAFAFAYKHCRDCTKITCSKEK